MKTLNFCLHLFSIRSSSVTLYSSAYSVSKELQRTQTGWAMKTENKRRSRIIRLVLLMAVLAVSQTIGFETSWKLQTVNATPSSSSAFQYIVTILMENNGLCDVTPSVVSG